MIKTGKTNVAYRKAFQHNNIENTLFINNILLKKYMAMLSLHYQFRLLKTGRLFIQMFV